MLIQGQKLREVLARTLNEIELRDQNGHCVRMLSKAEALDLDLDRFVDIGNDRRIRFLRSLTQRYALNAGSYTTRRPKGRDGKYIASPLVREHRPIG